MRVRAIVRSNMNCLFDYLLRFRKRGLFRKTFVSFLMISIAPQFLVACFLYSLLKGKVEDEINVKFRNISLSTLEQIDNVMTNHIANIVSWADVDIPKVGLYFNRPEGVRKYFNELVQNYKSYDLIVLVNAEGRIFSASDESLDGSYIDTSGIIDKDVKDQDWFQETVRNRVYVNDWNYFHLLEKAIHKVVPSVQVSSAVYSVDNELIGVISAFVSWDKIQSIIDNVQETYFKPGITSGYAYLVKSDGDTIIAHPDVSLYGRSIVNDLKLEEFRDQFKNNDVGLKYEYKGKSKTATCVRTISNQTPLENLRWIFCSSADDRDLYSSISNLKLIFLSVVGITIILALLFSVRFGQRIVKPILGLKEKAKRLSNGDYSVGKEIKTGDEIEELDKSFNKMVSNLEEYQRQFESNAALISIGQSTAMIAHDVRKPLTSMKALLSALPTIKDDPTQLSKMSATVDRNIQQTNQMLNDILEFSRDSTTLDIKEHNLLEMVTSALNDALRNHPDAQVKIEYSFNHTHYLLVDGVRIVRVLTNIIDNAIDAMDRNSIGLITFETHETNENGRSLVGIKVKDDGPGIPEDLLEKIFDPFFSKGKRMGTGLGLSICKRIVDIHEGRISAKNGDKYGAEILLELPMGAEGAIVNDSELIHHSKELKVFREEEAARIDYGDSANMAEFMRINKERGRISYLLMVDDEPLFRESVRCLLNDLGQVKDHVKFIEADSAENAFQLLKERVFDYVIVDIDMGKRKMNGYEFAHLLLERSDDVRVLIHSNKRREEMDKNIREITSARFMGFLPKPMTASQLLQFLACKTFEVSTIVADKKEPKKNVVIVNDDDAILISLKYMLESPSVSVISAENVSDALKKMLDVKVDMILSDINLGKDEPSGYDFLKTVREQDKDVPFYFVSGYSAKDEESKAYALGANGYFQLPIDVEKMKELLS